MDDLDIDDGCHRGYFAGVAGIRERLSALNILPATVAPDGRTVRLEGTGEVRLPLATIVEPNRPVLVGLRPEHLQFDEDGEAPQLTGTVTHRKSTGGATFFKFDVAGHPVAVTAAGRAGAGIGDRVPLLFDPADLHVFDRATEDSLPAQPGPSPRKAA